MARLQNEVGTRALFDARSFSRKTLRNVPKIVGLHFVGPIKSQEIPPNFSDKFPPQIKEKFTEELLQEGRENVL